MSIKYIPRELLDQICCHLNNRRHLLAVAKSCSFLYPVAQRILYRHINIDCLSTTLSVVLTLANNPHIAKYVKVFAMRVDPHAVLFLSFYRQLQRALENMSDLSSLDLFVHSSASWVLQSQKQFTYPRLVHFASSFPLDAHVAGFMAKANALLHLEVDSLPIPSSTNISSIPTNALPHLSCFVGSCEAAQVIVPGRPVESIHLNSGDLTEPVVETLAKSTAHVSILGATTSSRPVALLGSFAQNLSHLVSLRMMTTYNFSDAPDVVSPIIPFHCTFFSHV